MNEDEIEVVKQWKEEYEKCKDPVYLYSHYIVIKQKDGSTTIPPPLNETDKENMREWAGYKIKNKPQ